MGGQQSTEEGAASPGTMSSMCTSMKLSHAGIAKRFANVQHISTGALQTWIDERKAQEDTKEQDVSKLVVLDVRPEEEYDISHIEGSIRIHMDTAKDDSQLRQFVNENNLGQDNSTIVCYCSAGYRSSFLADKLQSLFHLGQADSELKNTSVYNLEGSLFQWAMENRAMIDKDGQPTKFAHPYNTVFSKLLSSDLRKWPEEKPPASL